MNKEFGKEHLQVLKHTLFSFLGTLGGALNLWTGITVVVFVEIIEYCEDRLFIEYPSLFRISLGSQVHFILLPGNTRWGSEPMDRNYHWSSGQQVDLNRIPLFFSDGNIFVLMCLYQHMFVCMGYIDLS